MNYAWDFFKKYAYNNRSGNYKTKIQFQFILDNLKNKTDPRILDIAGGAGRFAIPLLEYSKEITVLDINESAIKLLNERNKAIATICGDFMETEINGKFSVILLIEAIGYFKDWELFFTKVNFLLDKNGICMFTFTNNSSWRFFLRNFKMRFITTRSYTEMKFSDFKILLRKCGFKIETMDGMNWTPFPVGSNNPLVGVFEFLERRLRLNKWYSQSPWLLICIRKIN